MDRLDAPLCMRLGCKHSAEMAAKDAEIARLREGFKGAIIVEVVDDAGWSLSLLFGKGDKACDRMREASDIIRALHAKP